MQKHHAGHRMNSIIPVLTATIILVTVCIKPAAAENPFTVFGNQDTDTYIYYQIADADEYSEAMAMYHLEMMVNVFEYRGLIWGFDDLVITYDPRGSITVRVPDTDDFDDVIEVLETPSSFRIRTPDKQTVITGEHLKNVYTSMDYDWDGVSEDKYTVCIELNAEGTQLFKKYTGRYVGQMLEVYVDHQLILTPTVGSVVDEGNTVISGMNKETADDITRRLLSCHLPFEITRVRVHRAPTVIEKLLGIEPEVNGYERETLKSYLDETLT